MEHKNNLPQDDDLTKKNPDEVKSDNAINGDENLGKNAVARAASIMKGAHSATEKASHGMGNKAGTNGLDSDGQVS